MAIIYLFRRKIWNRPQVLLRIKVEQLLISHTRMVIKFLMKSRKKQKFQVFPKESLIFKFALGHIRSKEWDLSLVIIKVSIKFRAVPTKKYKIWCKWGTHSTVHSPFPYLQVPLIPVNIPHSRLSGEAKEQNNMENGLCLCSKGRKSQMSKTFQMCQATAMLCFMLHWSDVFHWVGLLVQEHKFCQISSKLWYREAGLLWMRQDEMEEMFFPFWWNLVLGLHIELFKYAALRNKSICQAGSKQTVYWKIFYYLQP